MEIHRLSGTHAMSPKPALNRTDQYGAPFLVRTAARPPVSLIVRPLQMTCGIAGAVGMASLLAWQAATAAPEAVGLPRRVLTDDALIDLLANTQCTDPEQRGNVLSEAQALAIARHAISVNETWSFDEGATFKGSRDECGWFVFVTRPNPGPGDHRLVRINREGKVLTYARGL